MPRLTLDEYYLKMLKHVADRSTCVRRMVGAIITDDHGQILATGYNGVPSGYAHCIDTPCAGAADKSGDTRRCMAVHAEQNALLQCRELTRAYTLYTSTLPCFTCAKMIANTPIKRVVYSETYPDKVGAELLFDLGREFFRDAAWGGEQVMPITQRWQL